MNENDEPMKAGYNLTRKHVEIVQAHADAKYYGNASMAVRNIIDEWAQDKHDVERELPMAQEAK